MGVNKVQVGQDIYLLDSIGRNVLEALVVQLAAENAELRKECTAYFDNLTHVQERCTELLEEARALRRVLGEAP